MDALAAPTGSVRPRAYVRSGQTASLPCPGAQVAIAVDTAFVAGAGGGNLSGGIYLMDNQLCGGSSDEGSFGALCSVVPVGSLVGYSAYPLDAAIGDTVEITGFQVVDGDVFGCAGYPLAQRPAYWIGQAIHLGTQRYQIQLRITSGALRPFQFYVHVGTMLRAC